MARRRGHSLSRASSAAWRIARRWGIQVRDTGVRLRPGPSRARTGTAFLQRKRRGVHRRVWRGRRTRRSVLRAALTELRRVAASGRPITVDADGGGGLVLDVVLLVASSGRARFLRAVSAADSPAWRARACDDA